MGIKGVGLTTGIEYNTNGILTSEFGNINGNNAQQVVHFNNNFLLISKGKAPNLKVKALFQAVVNANGQVTVVFGKTRITCE